MKLLLVLLSLIIYICNGQAVVNFAPVQTESTDICINSGGEEIGVGYMIVLDYCFNLDGKTSHIIINGTANSTYIHNSYENIGSSNSGSDRGLDYTPNCNGSPTQSIEFQEGSCQVPHQFNNEFELLSGFNVNITITYGNENWFGFPPRYYFNMYMQNYCVNEDVAVSEYIKSGSNVQQSDDSFTIYICKNKGQPYQQTCESPGPELPNIPNQCNPATLINETCVHTSSNVYKSVYCSTPSNIWSI